MNSLVSSVCFDHSFICFWFLLHSDRARTSKVGWWENHRDGLLAER